MVHPAPTRRGHADMAPLHRGAEHAVWTSASFQPLRRAHSMPPHHHRGQLPEPIRGAATLRRHPVRAPEGRPVHPGSPVDAQPRRRDAQPTNLGRRHGSRAEGGTPRPGRSSARPDASPARAPAAASPRSAASGFDIDCTDACARPSRRQAGETAITDRDGGAPPPRLMLQLQRQVRAWPQPGVQAHLPPRPRRR